MNIDSERNTHKYEDHNNLKQELVETTGLPIVSNQSYKEIYRGLYQQGVEIAGSWGSVLNLNTSDVVLKKDTSICQLLLDTNGYRHPYCNKADKAISAGEMLELYTARLARIPKDVTLEKLGLKPKDSDEFNSLGIEINLKLMKHLSVAGDYQPIEIGLKTVTMPTSVFKFNGKKVLGSPPIFAWREYREGKQNANKQPSYSPIVISEWLSLASLHGKVDYKRAALEKELPEYISPAPLVIAIRELS